MSLQPIIAQLHLIEGTVQSDEPIPGLFAQTAPSWAMRGRENDIVFLHISLSGRLERTAALLDDLTQVFIQTFFTLPGSTTAAMRQAVGAVNTHLLTWNQKAELKRQGALTAAVLRGEELFVSQVGEAQAFIGHSFGLEPIPSELPEEITPLGQKLNIHVRFYHNWLQAENILMLGDPRIAHLGRQAFVDSLVGANLQQAEQSLTQLLRQNSARLLLVEFNEHEEAQFGPVVPVAPPPVGLPERPQPTVPSDVPPEKKLPVRDSEQSIVDEIRQRRRAMLEEKAAQAATSIRAQEDDTPTSGPTAPETEVEVEVDEPESDFESESAEPPATTTSAPPELPPNVRPTPVRARPVRDPSHRSQASTMRMRQSMPSRPVREMPPPVDEDEAGLRGQTRNAASNALGGASRGARWLAEMLSALRAPAPADATAPANERLFATLIAIIIPVIVALIVSGVFIQNTQRSTLSLIREEMQVSLNAASGAMSTDPTLARSHFERVIALADEADGIVESDSDVLAKRTQATEQLDRMDGIARLNAQVMFQYPEDVELTALALGVDAAKNRYIFVLDSTNQVVYQHSADADFNLIPGDPIRIVGRGDGLQTHVVGELVDIIWKPVNAQTSVLTILDATGAAISWTPSTTGRQAIPLGLSSTWGEPIGLASYLGRIYVIDKGSEAGTAQLWRYIPDGNGFNINEDSASIIINDLEKANDVIIHSEDSSILVAYEDGRIRRYRNERLMWDDNTIREQGLNQPFVSPQALQIAGNGLKSSIYILDPGTNRVVELSFAGGVMVQFKASVITDGSELFAKANDFAVLENPRRIIVVADNKIAIADTSE